MWILIGSGRLGSASGLAVSGLIHSIRSASLLRVLFISCMRKRACQIYRQGRNYENLNKGIFSGTGAFDTPALQPERCKVKDFIGFNYAKTCKQPHDKGLHFFVDDYQFTRLWSNPDAYLELLQKFKCVCTPDFSTYTDFPKAVQIFNHYRKHWLGAYWQSNGITVIPTISWSDKASFEWCFDGEPLGGAVAVSSVGTQMNSDARALFLAGYREMLVRLQPSIIYFYGSIPNGCGGDNVVPLTAFQNELKKRCNLKEGML